MHWIKSGRLIDVIVDLHNFFRKEVDNTPMIAQLVKYGVEDLVIKEAWSGPAGLVLFDHVHAPIASLPVRKVLKGYHIIVDMTLGWGTVAHDYAVKHG